MPASRGHAPVLFDEDAWVADMARTSTNGRAVAEATRRDYEQDGCPIADLLACQKDAADGTNLPGCVKVYLPAPAGKFGMVFAIRRQEGRLVLAYIAFGVRHHPGGSHAPTVYEFAHQRMHGGPPGR